MGIEVIESSDIREFYQLNKKTFERQKRNIPYTFNFIENLYVSCKENGAGKVYVAHDEYGNNIAASFLIYDDNTVYYLMGGVDPEKKDIGGMDIVLYESIKFALNTGRNFDFEGSMIESIEKYFRSFGAIQVPYFNVTKTNSKLLKIRKALKG